MLPFSASCRSLISKAFAPDNIFGMHSRLAYVPAHSWNDANRGGRTSTHDPRLLTAQQPSRHEQVPAGDIEDQASGPRQVGRRILACRLFAQIESGPVGDAMSPIRSSEFASGAYRPLISPDSFRSGLVSDWKECGDDETRTRDLCRDS